MVGAVACEARGLGFDSSSDQIVYLLISGIGRLEKMDPDIINCVILGILGIHVDKKREFLAESSSGKN